MEQLNAALRPTRICNISKGGAHPPQTRHAISKGGTTTTVPNSKPHPSAKLHLVQVRRCVTLYRNRGSKFCHSPNHRSSPRIFSPHKGRQKRNLEKSFANELGRLVQGVGNRIDSTNTIYFKQKYAVPRSKKVTNRRLVCDIKEHKTETHQTRLTVGGNLLDFPVFLSTPTATVTTAKCLFNSVISTPGAKCLVADVKNLYLKNDLPEPEYMKLHIHIIPQEIIHAHLSLD